ncbi:MAG: restriction endonuclease [Verrucomicrobiia bacterium]
MAIPDYQTVLRPLLEYAVDQQEHSFADAVDDLAVHFKLSPDERKQLLPSGTQPVFENRMGWARTYLKKAGLLEYPGRGKLRITTRGLEVLKTGPKQIDTKFLHQFPEFAQFTSVTKKENTDEIIETHKGTPEEVLAASFQTLKQNLANELLDRIKQCPPKFFEKLVIDLLVAIGYGGSWRDAAQAVGHSGDGGIDGIIKQDRLGLDAIYVQAKRWEKSVERPEVQAFAGSLDGQKARKGVMITTSQFTAGAKEYVKSIEKKIVLIDGNELADLMIEHGVGVVPVPDAKYEVKKLDLDYFDSD